MPFRNLLYASELGNSTIQYLKLVWCHVSGLWEKSHVENMQTMHIDSLDRPTWGLYPGQLTASTPILPYNHKPDSSCTQDH